MHSLLLVINYRGGTTLSNEVSSLFCDAMISKKNLVRTFANRMRRTLSNRTDKRRTSSGVIFQDIKIFFFLLICKRVFQFVFVISRFSSARRTKTVLPRRIRGRRHCKQEEYRRRHSENSIKPPRLWDLW